MPTLKLKLIATDAVRRLHGHGRRAAALLRRPISTRPSGFSLNYAVNAIAMPLIGGTGSWLGPVVGAVLVGGLQEYLQGDDLVGRQRAGRGRADGRLRDRWRPRASSACSRGRSDDARCCRSTGLGKRFGGFVALEAIDLEVQQGERLGLIGPNGSGKSTLVNCICGTLRNESGSVRFADEALDGLSAHQRTRLGLARSFQLPRPFGSLSLAENLRIPDPLYRECARRPATSAGAAIDARCLELLGQVGLADKARATAARPDADRDAQARARPRHGGRAQAADRRRGDGRAVAMPRSTRSSRC